MLGLSLYLAGRFPEALPLLERTRTWAPDNLELNQVLGMTYIQLHRPDRRARGDRTPLRRGAGVGRARAC